MRNMPLVVADHGAPALAPENTIASFAKALDVGAHRIAFEVDVMGDGTVLVMKDDTLDRTTSGSGSYYRVGYGELRHLDAGGWFSDVYRFERVPELADVIGFLNSSGLVGMMKIKPSQAGRELRERLIEGIVASLQALTVNTDQFLAVSSDAELLTGLHQANPSIQLGFDSGALLHSAPKVAADMGARVVVTEDRALNEHETRLLVNAGLAVFASGVDSTQRAQELGEWGVHAVLSEHPEAFPAEVLAR